MAWRRRQPQAYTNTGGWRTATFSLPDALWNDSLAGGNDLRLAATGPADLEARFVRVVRLTRPRAIFLDGFESGTVRLLVALTGGRCRPSAPQTMAPDSMSGWARMNSTRRGM